MTDICLPRCDWPAFTTILCDMPNPVICCVQWTMECDGTTYTIIYPGYTLLGGQILTYCDTANRGVNPGLAHDGGSVLGCAQAATDSLSPNCPARPLSDYPASAWGCVPDYLGIPGPVYAVFPYLVWECIGYDSATQVLFEAGWSVYYSDPFPRSGCQCIRYPVARGVASADWWKGSPFTLNGIEVGYPSTVVTPIGCYYFPCGTATDCFPDCISGTNECDGTTPAHAPIMLTISAAEACCLTGTFPLIYNNSSHKYVLPTDAAPSCDIDSDCVSPVTLTLGAELYCANYPESPSDPLDEWTQDDIGLAMLHIWMTDGCGDRQDFYALVILLCAGVLTPATGTFSIDTMCGDNSTNEFDWTIST